ncbi:uncharacterized protein LOC143596728 [Bidens hawaiensis]|uniref:uncharacterized protein LOC143596728 n=1 Tax=Bidens hawaiensis TaxID=980011 RepID=UPI00404A41BF
MAIAGPWRKIGNVSVSFDLLGINLWSNMKWVIGSGSDSMFWIDNWIGESPLNDQFPLLFKLKHMKGCKVGDKLVIYERELCGVWSWYRQLVSTDEINEFRQLLILCSGATVGDGIDRLIWALDGSGDFSINSIKKHVGEWCYPDATWASVGTIGFQRRFVFFAWRVGLERVASLVELAKRNIVFGSVLCPLCGEVDETVEHIFASCGFAQHVWQTLAHWSNIPNCYVFSVRDILEMHKYSGFNSDKREMFQGVCLTALWVIWKARNEVVFNGRPAILGEVVADIKSLAFLWLKNRPKRRALTWENWRRFEI